MSSEHSFVFHESHLLGPAEAEATGHCLHCGKPGTIRVGLDSQDLHVNWRTASEPLMVGDLLGLKEPGACQHERFEFVESEDIESDGCTVIKIRCQDCGKAGVAGITWPSDIVHWEGEPWDGSCRHHELRFVKVDRQSSTELRVSVRCDRCGREGLSFIWYSMAREDVIWREMA